jgi:collagen type III alpha
MPGQFGVSFLPGQSNGMDRNGQGGNATEPIQQAIKVLSLRLPRVLGGGAFAPSGLLQGGGSMGNPFAGVGPMQGRPLPPGGLPGGGGPPPGGGAGSPGGGGSPFGGGAGNPFAGSMPGPDPMSQAIMALVGGGGGSFGAPPSMSPAPHIIPGINPTTPPAGPPPIGQLPDRGTAPPPYQPPAPDRGTAPPSAPAPAPEPPPLDLGQPPPAPEPGPAGPDNGDLPRELAMWLYRNRGRGFEY